MSGGKKYWVGFGIGAGFLALFFVTGDWQRLGDALAQANYWYLIPAVLLYQLSVVFRTMRWQVLLRQMRPVPVSRLFPVVVIGYMANNLLPMRIGELVRSYYVSEREQISKTSALVTIVIERLLDALTLLIFIAVIAIFVPLLVLAEGFGESSRVPWPALVAGISLPFILALGGLMLAAYRPARAAALGGALLKPLPHAFAGQLRPLIDLVIQGLAALGSPRTDVPPAPHAAQIDRTPATQAARRAPSCRPSSGTFPPPHLATAARTSAPVPPAPVSAP